MKLKFIHREAPKLDKFCGWKIYEKPKELVSYTLGVDTAEGVGGDGSCIQVINNRSGLVSAVYWSNVIDLDNFAAEVYKGGTYYNKGFVVVEANSTGAAVITHLGGAVGGLCYPNLYRRVVFDEYTQKRGKQIGFKTTRQTKPHILENLKAALRDGDLQTRDKETLKELNDFSQDTKTGKLAAQGSAHDDRVMALAIAWEGALQSREAIKYTEQSYQEQARYDSSTGFPIF